MESRTNKELLEIILNQTKENAKNQLDFSCRVSSFMNKQNLFNAEIKGYLESNSKTNQKGIIEQVSANTQDIHNIKTEKKIEKRTIAVISTAIGSAITYASKLIF
jgi:hypothetical protein